MRRFETMCGSLVLFLIVCLAVTSGGGRGNRSANLLEMALLAVFLVWFTVAAMRFVLQIVISLGRAMAVDLARLVPHAGGPSRAFYTSPDLIERLCRESGWLLVSREYDLYTVRSGDHTVQRHIHIRWSERFSNAVFSCWSPVTFSLEYEAKGLHAYLMMRSSRLIWCSWLTTIGHSCESCPYLVASIPAASLDAQMFARVCGEIADEINAFHHELLDKFRYNIGQVMTNPPPPVWVETRGGLPVRRSGDMPDIRFRD